MNVLNKQKPKYIQIKEHLISGINNGIWKEGDKLPTELELQSEFNMSRLTIRHAIREVNLEGYIISRPGKGTIVRHKMPVPQIMRLTSFTDDMVSRGKNPTSKTLDVSFVIPPFRVHEAYQINKLEEVWRVQRLRYADDIPIALQDLYIHPDMQISARELWQIQSFYQFLKEHKHLQPAYATETLTAINADKNDSEIMNIREGDPLISIWRVTFTEDESIIEVVHIKYIAKRYDYYIKLFV